MWTWLLRFLKSHGIALGLVAICAVLQITSIRAKSPTFDEIGHLTGGYSYWLTNDYRLFPQNGKLPTRWAAIALLPFGYRFPALDQPAWEKSDINELGHQFFYTSGNDPQRMIWLGRMAMIPLTVLLCWTVYAWSRRLFGKCGGLISLTLTALSPAFLAHGRLVTSDVPAALGFLGALALFWAILHHVTVPRLLASGLAMGALFVTKMSAWWLVPVVLLLIGVRLVSGPALVIQFRSQRILRSDGAQLAAYVAIVIGHLVCVLGLIWAFYGFRFATFHQEQDGRDEMYFGETVESLAGSGAIGRAIMMADKKRVLPEAYLFGIAHVVGHSRGHPALLAGKHRLAGWWYFFPYCFLVKTPLPTLALLAIAFVVAASRMYAASTDRVARNRLLRTCYPLTPLYAFMVVYWLVAMSSSLNIGERHILPAYPPMFVLAGALGTWRPQRLAAAAPVVICGLLAWTALEVTSLHPHYLAYFNSLAGGPRQGYRHLVDSSLDWGQDLPGLKQWIDLQRKRDETSPIYLSYFGSADPAYYRLDARLLSGYLDWRDDTTARPLTEGIYCISATLLQGLYLDPGGSWTLEHERQYRALQAAAAEPAQHQDATDRKEQSASDLFSRMRFARLLSHLRSREPDDHVGYSILIYRVSRDEISRALD